MSNTQLIQGDYLIEMDKLNMKPNKDKILEILTDVERLRKRDDEIQEAWNTFMKVVAPDSYPPILEEGTLNGYLLAMKTTYGETIYEDLTYWAYEAIGMKKPITASYKGVEYDISTKERYADFMLL